MSYHDIKIISTSERDVLFDKYRGRFLYEKKADIYGVCVKLITDIEWIKDAWEENFYSMSENIRSHGRLLVLFDSDVEPQIMYDPVSKTVIMFNIDYYGKIKSIALSNAGDILEDNHGIYSVHGACIDYNGSGICIIAPSGAGKTTHTYGLLRYNGVRVVSDDWFYARVYGANDILAFSSEKNFYIRADIIDIWPEYRNISHRIKFDNKGRSIIHINWIVGKERLRTMATLKTTILLKRDYDDPEKVVEVEPGEALKYLERNDYFNPHMLVLNEYKERIRRKFFNTLLHSTKIFTVNTTSPPEETNRILYETVKSSVKD
ncbi:MAG: aldolase [Candidatus Odinarchaeum yellowstonii]|uniref:Aldolase n=1 Tax=Odinarchaeota yellowstonii (strain LCB_4) TaxID=1841599 RepID=A0AAF0D1T0_ODILC|nr:MAG: aldolase [Candidatus Odinarchaeum yellowstonii]